MHNLQSGACLVLPHHQVNQEQQLRMMTTGTATLGKGMTRIPNNLPNNTAGAGLRVPQDKNTATHGHKMGNALEGHYANMPPRMQLPMALRHNLDDLDSDGSPDNMEEEDWSWSKHYKNKDQGPKLTAPKGWDPDVERVTLPTGRIREIRLRMQTLLANSKLHKRRLQQRRLL